MFINEFDELPIDMEKLRKRLRKLSNIVREIAPQDLENLRRLDNEIDGYCRAISDMMDQDKENEFYFGFEESNGFLFSPFIRDKDGISSAALIASMACKQKARGKDLIDRLEEIYDDYGLLIDKSRSFTFEGLMGIETMNEIMEFIRNLDENIGDLYIEDKLDYLYDDTDLPKSNVVRFDLDDGSTVIIRPSGTEPKIKVYMFLSDPTSQIEKEIIKIFDQFKQDN